MAENNNAVVVEETEDFNYFVALEDGSELVDRTHMIYDSILLNLDNDGIEWKDISNHLIYTVLYEGWETKTNKKTGVISCVGIQKAIAAGHKPAVWLNRFNVYRNKFSNYDTLKPKVEKSPLTPAGNPKADDKTREEAATDNKTDKPVVVKKEDVRQQMQAVLTFVQVDMNKTEDEDRKEDLKMLESLLIGLYNL